MAADVPRGRAKQIAPIVKYRVPRMAGKIPPAVIPFWGI
jgi:hypothetical protein